MKKHKPSTEKSPYFDFVADFRPFIRICKS